MTRRARKSILVSRVAMTDRVLEDERMIDLPPGVRIEDVPVEKKYRSSTAALMNRIRRL